jgi:hypothetical protein
MSHHRKNFDCAIFFLGDVDPKTIWSMEKMQAYLSLIKTINPELSPEAIR